jgi:uncharacterized protein YndB with AHSA1/START domain
MVEPLRLSVRLGCPVAHAFHVWTAKIAMWWPADHTVTGADDLNVVLEPRVGGRIFERTATGVEHDWGEVTVWEPPHRLGYLWHLRRDRADATDVEITFVPDGPDATRVDIVHGGWDRLGALGPDWREANKGGWSTLLPHLLAFVEGERAG